MKMTAKLIIAIMITLMMGGLQAVCSQGSQIKMIPLYIGQEKFTVEIADTEEKWALGLMFREFIADDYGMLFVSDYPNHRSFWMKNCKVHLDIIFLDSNKQVINIHANVPPCKADPCTGYPSDRPAQYVLELRANRAKELKLKPGDTIDFTFNF